MLVMVILYKIARVKKMLVNKGVNSVMCCRQNTWNKLS